ncbi:MAG: hypothetical protein L0Y42_02120, partial [Phycisphaerales bacterium]|nr:hypothetical protein [Phycisphaerales bacterium]
MSQAGIDEMYRPDARGRPAQARVIGWFAADPSQKMHARSASMVDLNDHPVWAEFPPHLSVGQP